MHSRPVRPGPAYSRRTRARARAPPCAPCAVHVSVVEAKVGTSFAITIQGKKCTGIMRGHFLPRICESINNIEHIIFLDACRDPMSFPQHDILCTDDQQSNSSKTQPYPDKGSKQSCLLQSHLLQFDITGAASSPAPPPCPPPPRPPPRPPRG